MWEPCVAQHGFTPYDSGYRQAVEDLLALIAGGNVTALAGLTLAADRGIYGTGAGTLGTYPLTGYGRQIGGLANAAALRGLVGMERGANANGQYARWGDGTQICTRSVTINMNTLDPQDFAMASTSASVDGGGVMGLNASQFAGAGSANRMQAVGALPVAIFGSTWRVRLPTAIASDSVTVGLFSVGRWS